MFAAAPQSRELPSKPTSFSTWNMRTFEWNSSISLICAISVAKALISAFTASSWKIESTSVVFDAPPWCSPFGTREALSVCLDPTRSVRRHA